MLKDLKCDVNKNVFSITGVEDCKDTAAAENLRIPQ